MIVVDDQLLFDLLADEQPDNLIENAGQGVATTFSWYYRLARAIAADRIEGALSRRFAGLADNRQSQVRSQLDDLSTIEIVGAKELVPVMSALATVTSVNLLTADAVATALILDAPILVSTRSELLNRAAAVAGVPTQLIDHTG